MSKKRYLNKTSVFILINAFFILLLVGAVILKERNFDWKDWLRYKVSLVSSPSTELIGKNLSEEEILKFAVIGDAHIGATMYNESFLINALEKAKGKEAKFVVLIGDVSENGKLEELKKAKEVLEKSEIDYYVVPGNHDYRQGNKENYKKIFGRPYNTFEISIDEKNGSLIRKATIFLLDNAYNAMPNRLISLEQMSWLENEMINRKRNEDELIFVFQQTPLVDVPTLEQNFLKINFCRLKIDGLFSAHLHLTQRYHSGCISLSGAIDDSYTHIPTFIVGTIYNTNEFPGFALMHYYKNKKFEVERVLLDEYVRSLIW